MKKKRVLFVNAINPISEIENRYRPLWPAYLAAFCDYYLGIDKLEFRFMTGSLQDEIKFFKPNIVAISAVSQNFNYAKIYAKIAKECSLSVIMGGIHISNIPNCLTKDMDVGVIGEGEETFFELMSLYLEFGNLCPDQLSKIKGIVYYNDCTLIKTPVRSMYSMDKFLHPKRSLIGYQSHDYMFTSRGCPFQCVFCASSRYWQKVRWSSAEHVMEEIQELIENGVKTISFYDDLFIINKKRLLQIADMIIANNINKQVKFTCNVRANTITQDIVEILKAMNVVSVGMGLESGSDRVLKYLKGEISVHDNLKAINLFKNARIQANASFVIGSPDETEEEIMQTYNFIKNSRLDFIDIYLLTPLPGTPIWDSAVKRGLVSVDMDWNRLNINNFKINSDVTIVVSEKLSRQKLFRIYKMFKRLRFILILKALPKSPWLRDLPKIGFRLLVEKLSRFVYFIG